MKIRSTSLSLVCCLLSATGRAQDNEPLFQAVPFTEPGEFTKGVEGPATDREGNIYAVNFAEQGTIGIVEPEGGASLFVKLPEGSTGNGIRFDRAGRMYVADYTGHNVLRIDMTTKAVTVFAHEPAMNQPNDLAIGPDGTLYASDPNWKEKTGQIWRIGTDGKVTKLAENMGTTNGIEVSPNGKTLYVAESEQRKVWGFNLHPEGSISDKWLVKEFPDYGMDGMRCDVDGNLYITRHGKGTVVKLSPKGEVLKEIELLGKNPTNLCFGGPDGRTVYVTEVDYTGLATFRVDRPGLEWQRWQENAPPAAAVDWTPGEVDLVIVAGQSNAVGYDAKPTELTADPRDEKVFFWFRTGDPPPDEHDTTSGNEWTTLRPQPLGNPLPRKSALPRQYGNFAQTEGGFGPEIGFAREMMARRPDRRLAMLKAAFSGTGIAKDWDHESEGDAGSCYRALLAEFKLAGEKAKAAGVTLKPRAFLWVQGESDATPNDAPKYAERLTNMITALRRDLGAPDLKALLAVNTKFGGGKNSHMPAIVEAQKAVDAADPLAVYVDTAAATIANTFHYDAAGTLEVGKWFAEAYLKLAP